MNLILLCNCVWAKVSLMDAKELFYHNYIHRKVLQGDAQLLGIIFQNFHLMKTFI
jgi:hypothetical protein